MKLINYTFRLLKSERGAVLFIVAAAMFSLLGVSALVTDIGLIAVNRQKLINTMDAAALAGALELPNTGSAETIARQYALNNKYVPQNAGDPQVSVSGNSITVQGSNQVNLVFARIFGWNYSNVSASATARVQALTGYKGALPLTVDDVTLASLGIGQEFQLKTDTPSIGSGNFGALSLGTDDDYDSKDSGASAYRQNLANGSPQIIRVGDQLLTKPGNMTGPTGQGLKDRIDGCACTISTYTNHRDCPRLVIIPVYKQVPYKDLNGRTKVTVAGFAPVLITKVNGSKVYARVLDNIQKDGESSLTQVNYGVTKPVLVN